ncbi:MAG: C4-type zinc ribbon domain-containing protein [Deferribacteraceae bacterium]|jgi:predicted  nucleic acid-binding Zn-ribbon protein|nr:C4-type zinc ribbon domain-containing protein [Deferribacteraceae bacterium]
MVHETIEQLIKLQAMDTRLYIVDSKLAMVPEAVRAVKSEYERLKQNNELDVQRFTALKDEHTSAKISLEEKKDMASAAQKKLLSVQNSREYEAALKEMDNLKRDISALEKQTADAAIELKRLEAAIAELSAACEEKDNLYNRLKREKEVEDQALHDEAALLRRERAEFAETIKKNITARYERIRKARNNVAIAPIISETCTGCNMKVPPQFAVDVKKERDLLQCPYCQRFLYSPEKEAVTKNSA